VDKIDLTSAEYWTGPGIDLRLNPKRSYETGGLREAVHNLAGLDAAIVLATSGSEGQVKYVVLEKSALLASAKAVNCHCKIGASDVWLAGLSTFHVGGLGIYARAFLSGSRVETMPWDKWKKDGSSFLKACNEGRVTVTSLTPVHLFDLVDRRIKSPSSLRGVFIGGGTLSEDLASRARELGWPLWTTYGMTETSSQIATSIESLTDLPILPIWETATDEKTGRLKVRGEALFAGYLTRDEATGIWGFNSARDSDAWFTTGDCAELGSGNLQFTGRADDLVKVLGELVSVRKLEKQLCDLGLKAVVIPKQHSRRGHQLFAFVEGGLKEFERAQQFNEGKTELEKFAEIDSIIELPTTDLGKVDRSALRKIIKSEET